MLLFFFPSLFLLFTYSFIYFTRFFLPLVDAGDNHLMYNIIPPLSLSYICYIFLNGVLAVILSFLSSQ